MHVKLLDHIFPNFFRSSLQKFRKEEKSIDNFSFALDTATEIIFTRFLELELDIFNF